MRRALGAVVLLLLVAATAAACGGDDSVPVPGMSSASALRDETNGFPGVTSTVTVRFDRPVQFASKSTALISIFTLQVPDYRRASDTLKQVIPASAAFAEGSDRIVVLKLNQLVPDGAKLQVARRAFRPGDAGTVEAPIDSDLAPYQATLAAVALGISDAAIVTGDNAPAPTAADDDPAAMRALLDQLLQDLGSSDDTRQRALARYDSMPAAIVPSPKLRATLAALTGTFAEPAIDDLLTANNCTGRPVALIVFQVPPDNSDLLAQVTFLADGRRVVSLQPSLKGERLEHLMPLLAHEAIHCDQEAGFYEEIAATAFDVFLSIQLMSVEPDIVTDGTRATREFNINAIALINSGRAIPESVGVLPSPGVKQVLVGTNAPYASFAAVIAEAYAGLEQDTTSDEPLAQAYVETLAQLGGITTPGSAFDLDYLDAVLGSALDPRTLIAAIDALALVAPGN